MNDTERLDWVLANRHMRVQGSDESGWSVLDLSNGLTFYIHRMDTARDAIDAAMERQSGRRARAEMEQ